MEIGNKVSELRKKHGLSQENLAEKLNVSRQTISKWELNETSPDLKQAKKLSKIFKISLDELAVNDIKDILTEKISNTERLAGLTMKTLKYFGIFIIIFLIIFIAYKVIISFSTYAWFIGSDLNHKCLLRDETYFIEIKPEINKNNKKNIVEESYKVNDIIVSPFIGIPNLEKYDKVYQVKNVIYTYFEKEGGTCNTYFPEYFND